MYLIVYNEYNIGICLISCFLTPIHEAKKTEDFSLIALVENFEINLHRMRVQEVKTKNAKMYRHLLTLDDTYRRRDERKDQIHKMAPTTTKNNRI